MDEIFWRDLQLPDLNYNLQVGSGMHGQQTGLMLQKIESVLLQENPNMVLVQGDTNSVLAGSLAATKLQIPIAHVEAGLRSYDRTMPEEINRVLTGAIARWHFVPTQAAKQNLLKEGIPQENIYVTGNTIVDAVIANSQIAATRSTILQDLSLSSGKYLLATVHRPENTDQRQKLADIVTAFEAISKKYALPIIWPMHPRTKKQLELFGLNQRLNTQGREASIIVIDPVGFFAMLQLLSNCSLVMTDSGGVQEEACILQVPCVTLRNNTERPESVSVGANILVGSSPQRIKAAVAQMIDAPRTWVNPFGDGTAAAKIMAVLRAAIH